MEDLTGSSLPRYLLIETFPNVKWFIIFYREEIHPLEVFNIKLSPMRFNLLNYSVVKSCEFCRHILFENTFSVQAWNVKFCDWICSSKRRIAVWFGDNIEGKIAKCIESFWWSGSFKKSRLSIRWSVKKQGRSWDPYGAQSLATKVGNHIKLSMVFSQLAAVCLSINPYFCLFPLINGHTPLPSLCISVFLFLFRCDSIF